MKILKRINKIFIFFTMFLLLVGCEEKFRYSYDNFKRFNIDKPVILDLDVFVSCKESKCLCKEGDLFNYYASTFNQKNNISFSNFLYLAFNQELVLDCKQLGFDFIYNEKIKREYEKMGFINFKKKYYNSVKKALNIERNNPDFLSVKYVFFINNYTFIYKKQDSVVVLVKITDILTPPAGAIVSK